MVLDPGAVVAGYRIEKVLGSGGMGTVYLAANPVLPRHDALKVLSSELSQDPAFRARFMREADLAGTLDHPNIVTVYTRGEIAEGQLWIAMQYVAGTDAHKERDEGRMTAMRAVYIVGEVAKALDYVHRRNLIHRDVKPANFLLASGDERVLLADFGIARALDDSAGLTATGMVMATVDYAAPETLSGGHLDGRADIYALGCSLYQMLTGQAPFASSVGMAAVAAAHLSEPPPRATDRVPTLPTAIDAVIAKAMAKNPDDRYPSARAFAEAAGTALQGGAGTPQPPPAHASRLATLSIVFAFVLAPAGAVLAHLALAQNKTRGQPRSDRALVGLTLSYAFMVLALVAAVAWTFIGNHSGAPSTVGASATNLTPTMTTSQPPPEPTVASADLPKLLLGVDEIKDITKVPGITMVHTAMQPDNPPADFDPAECEGALVNGQPALYRGSGYRGFYVMVMQDTPPRTSVAEAALTFENAAAAQGFVSKSVDKWRQCAGKQFTFAKPDKGFSTSWTLGNPSESGGVTTIINTNNVRSSFIDARALAAKANVVVDLSVNGYDVTNDEITTIASRILERVPS